MCASGWTARLQARCLDLTYQHDSSRVGRSIVPMTGRVVDRRTADRGNEPSRHRVV